MGSKHDSICRRPGTWRAFSQQLMGARVTLPHPPKPSLGHTDTAVALSSVFPEPLKHTCKCLPHSITFITCLSPLHCYLWLLESAWPQREGVALKVQEQMTRMKTTRNLVQWIRGPTDSDWGAESTLSPAFIPDCRIQNLLWSVFPKILHWHSPDLVFTLGRSLLGNFWKQLASA